MRIQDKLRASSVSRWHIVATAKPQSLAEHSFNVAMIAQEIAIRTGHSVNMAIDVQAMALEHDLDEILYGDIPTPAKGELEIPHDTRKKIVKLADLIDTFTFIRMNYVDRHGQRVSVFCEKRMHDFLDHIDDGDRQVALSIVEEILQGDYA